jgi:quercetin dioxygenase-like cupin family protein
MEVPMAIPHAAPGELLDVRPLAAALPERVTQTLIRTAQLEVIRLVLPKGKEIAEHRVDGEITVHCLEGRVAFTARGQTQELPAGHMLYLAGGDPHALKGIEDSSLLVTIIL